VLERWRRMFDGFEEAEIPTARSRIFVRRGGAGPPLLLLHGFPETHLMWRDIAPELARQFTIVCADLPGCGRSGCPRSAPDHEPYSKRAMGRDMVDIMARLGFRRFAVAGHDRGGRVALRLALDHPDRIERLIVLDVLPNSTTWDRADARLALAFWPWSLLAQPEPLPERLIGACPEAVVDDALTQWDSPRSTFPQWVRDAYVQALRDPAHVHAICEEYRAAATVDREHDEEDQKADRRIGCPLLVLWSRKGGLEHWYKDAGGPLQLWREWAGDVDGQAIDGGHFFPEERPKDVAKILSDFLVARSRIAPELERV
jgi:haloacetate dehalogenase